MKKNKLIKDHLQGIRFLFACLFTLMYSQYSNAQGLPFVDNISYQNTESQRIAFPNGTTFEDIHAYDMPSLEYREMSYLIEKKLDSDRNPQTLQTLTGAVNFHEDWQRLAERWLFDQNGTTLYDVQGKGRNKSYVETEFIEHSRKGLEVYSYTKEQVNLEGYLSSLVFPSNIKEILDGNTLQSEVSTPYIIAPDGSVIVTNDGGEYIIYQEIENTDDGESIGIIKQIKYQVEPNNSVYPVFPDENDPEVVSFTISVFDFDMCGELFLSSTTDVVKEVLFNGLCAKRITENVYSDYNFDCQQTALRSFRNDESVGEMTLSPNPLRSDLLNISLPLTLDNEEVEIDVISLNGQSMGKTSQVVSGDRIQLNLGDVITTQGLYMISINSSKYTSTKKIYYTKN